MSIEVLSRHEMIDDMTSGNFLDDLARGLGSDQPNVCNYLAENHQLFKADSIIKVYNICLKDNWNIWIICTDYAYWFLFCIPYCNPESTDNAFITKVFIEKKL